MRADVRRRIMSAIRKTNTKPELIVRRYLHSRGLRFRLHAKMLPGAPDIVLSRLRSVVLVHGCFWHRCSHCSAGKKIVRSNPGYWEPKFKRNIARDAIVLKKLTELGWDVSIVWECQVHDENVMAALARKLLSKRRSL